VRVLGGAAPPLFIASSMLLIAGAVASSRLVATFATVARLLLYLSMLKLAHGSGGSGSMSMMTTSHGHGAARADRSRSTRASPPSFSRSRLTCGDVGEAAAGQCFGSGAH
jgi:hypothetical protein